MEIQSNFNLAALNTFHLEAYAEQYSEFSDEEELKELLYAARNKKVTVLGGGSNVLLVRNVEGWVLRNRTPGIEVVHEDEKYVEIRAGAGEAWHKVVMYAVNSGWGGIENLALIPGTMGAAPIQNIGAYGVELKDSFVSLEAFNLQDGTKKTFLNPECNFGYRDSLFKRKEKGRYAILNVTVRLTKSPLLHTSYYALAKELEASGLSEISVREVANAVIKIRRSKLPNPDEIGNAGSFFKNPVVSKKLYNSLLNDYPQMPHYDLGKEVKIPAAWLIETLGFKGYREGDAGCHVKQPLVLVNYGNATGRQIFELSEKIIRKVFDTFGITLEREVNVL